MARCALSDGKVYFFYFVFCLYSLILNLIILSLFLLSHLQHYEILSSEVRGNRFNGCHKHLMNCFLLDETVTALSHLQ